MKKLLLLFSLMSACMVHSAPLEEPIKEHSVKEQREEQGMYKVRESVNQKMAGQLQERAAQQEALQAGRQMKDIAFNEGGDHGGIPVDIEGRPIFVSDTIKQQWLAGAQSAIKAEKDDLLSSRNEQLKQLRAEAKKSLGVSTILLKSNTYKSGPNKGEQTTLYSILGLAPDASVDNVQAAFKQLVPNFSEGIQATAFSLLDHNNRLEKVVLQFKPLWKSLGIDENFESHLSLVKDTDLSKDDILEQSLQKAETMITLLQQARDVLVDSSKRGVYDTFLQQDAQIRQSFSRARKVLGHAQNALEYAQSQSTISNADIAVLKQTLSQSVKDVQVVAGRAVLHKDQNLSSFMKGWGQEFLKKHTFATRGQAK